DFPSVVNAVQCAQRVQEQIRAHNAEKGKTEQIHVRIGIHLGDIVQKNGDVLGDGVNIAARLQTLAEPGTICISRKVYEEVEKKLPSQARQLFEKAIELDPQYAEAYASLGGIYYFTWLYQWSQDPQALERAFELAQQTVTLDDSLPAAHNR